MSVGIWVALPVCVLGIAVILAIAIRRRNVPGAVNAMLSLLLALAPILVERIVEMRFDHRMDLGPGLPVGIAFVGLLHAYGMLGPYDEIWWWDHLTHTIAATIIAAAIYSGLLVISAHPTYVIASMTVGGTLFLGIFWELVELVAREVGKHYRIEPVLTHYGWRDTLFDLVFDAVGALIVVVLGVAPLEPVATRFPRETRWLLYAGATFVTIGTIILIGIVIFSLRRRR